MWPISSWWVFAPVWMVRWFVYLLGVIFIGLIAMVFYFDGADRAYKRGDYATAFERHEFASHFGDKWSQYTVGKMFSKGLDVEKNLGQAAKYYQLSAEKGYSRAQSNLGYAYMKGHGVPMDAVEARKWFQLAADQGDAVAQYWLGRLYFEGNGVAQDDTLALKWFKEAASQWKIRGHLTN